MSDKPRKFIHRHLYFADSVKAQQPGPLAGQLTSEDRDAAPVGLYVLFHSGFAAGRIPLGSRGEVFRSGEVRPLAAD